MLDSKDSISLDQVIIQGLREQLMMQETSVLYITRPDQLSVSTLMSMEKDYLDELSKSVTEQQAQISLIETSTE